MTLSDLYRTHKYNTDKNTTHSYIDYFYNDLFSHLDREKISDILEIGTLNCGSIFLWQDFFTNAKIDTIDINYNKCFKNSDRLRYMIFDAYQKKI